MYRAKSIKLYFEDNKNQNIDIQFGGVPDNIFVDVNIDPNDSYSGSTLKFTIKEFEEFIAACQEALKAKREDNG